MNIILRFLSALVPDAVAKNIEQLGSGDPAIASMWQSIKDIFPHTDVGEAGVAYIALKITDFILRTIGGLAVVMILWGAIRIITGGEEGVTEGKKIVMYSVMGLIAAMVADAIVIYAQVLVVAASK